MRKPRCRRLATTAAVVLGASSLVLAGCGDLSRGGEALDLPIAAIRER